MNERRRFSRVDADAQVVIEDEADKVRGQMINLSLAGAAVRFEPLPSVVAGDHLDLRVLLSHDVRFWARLVVTWRSEDAVGGYWFAMDSEGLAHLKRMLSLNTGSPATVQAELLEWIRSRPGPQPC